MCVCACTVYVMCVCVWVYEYVSDCVHSCSLSEGVCWGVSEAAGNVTGSKCSQVPRKSVSRCCFSVRNVVALVILHCTRECISLYVFTCCGKNVPTVYVTVWRTWWWTWVRYFSMNLASSECCRTWKCEFIVALLCCAALPNLACSVGNV